MRRDRILREHLLYLLLGGGAHANFESVVADFPIDAVHRKIDSLPYTPWAVLEHMRIAQWDIIEFCYRAGHISPKWPRGYWPTREVKRDAGRWNKSVDAFRTDQGKLEALIVDPTIDLLAPIAHGDGQTILREALLVADHNAYHLGVLVTMKRLLGAMKNDA